MSVPPIDETRFIAYMARYAGSDIGADLEAIARQSARNNARDGVTGALVYDRGQFIQVIEGSSSAVIGVLLRVMDDPRAREITVLHDRWIHGRTMADWDMQVLRTDQGAGGGAFELAAFREAYAHVVRCNAHEFAARMKALAASLT